MRFNLDKHWYAERLSFLSFILMPLSLVFGFLAYIRRLLYRSGLKKSYRAPVPVIIVGNITTGGTGKTPFVLWLADFLQRQGLTPGIISRGYGGKKTALPQHVTAHSDPVLLGDEAVLLARRVSCPLVVSSDRVAAVKKLMGDTDCNIIICDDGLQHYRLKRQLEIAMVDGKRRFGNRSLLPAGPLREPVSRLRQVDFVVTQGDEGPGEHAMQLEGEVLVSLTDPEKKKNLAHFKDTMVHAIAGIGHPERFFSFLRAQGLQIVSHAFADHHYYKARDLHFADNLPIIMTEKDAVKCGDLADDRYWYLPVDAKLDAAFEHRLLKKLGEMTCVF